MKSNELRIGNYVNIDGDALYVTGSDIAYFEYNDKEYTAIPLTPEILEKAGFVSNSIVPFIKGRLAITARHDQDYIFEWCKRDDQFGSPGTSFKYVHELQNLYFALTGEELPIEL